MIDYSFTKYADKQLRKFPISIQRRIIKKVEFYLNADDPLHFADSIKGSDDKIYRFRIGDYRVIFEWIGNRIRILKVSIRPRAY